MSNPIDKGFGSINRSPEQISETANLILHHPRLEYDQGDGLTMEYDDAFDLAEAFLMVLGVARKLEEVLKVVDMVNITCPYQAHPCGDCDACRANIALGSLYA